MCVCVCVCVCVFHWATSNGKDIWRVRTGTCGRDSWPCSRWETRLGSRWAVRSRRRRSVRARPTTVSSPAAGQTSATTCRLCLHQHSTLRSASSLACLHDTARICGWTPCCGDDRAGARSCRSLSPARMALSSKPPHAAAAAIDGIDRQTDRRKDARPFQKPCTAGSINN